MGDKDDGFPCQNSCDAFGEDVAADVDVNCRQGVVEEIDVTVAIQSASQTDPLLLATTEVDTSLSNLHAAE